MTGARIVLVLLTGMPGSGKEEFVKMCADRGIRVLRMGDFVRAEAASKGLPMTDSEVGGFAHRMREEKGYDYWARRTAEALDDKLTLIDGLRGKDEFNLFHKRAKRGLLVVAVKASPHVRFQRLRARGRSDAPATFADFEERDRREKRWGLGEVIANANHVIENESTLEMFHKKAKVVIDDIVERSKE
jgi:dephospho-CoA kinase